MRIVYLADTRAIGGAERYLAALVEHVADNAHEALVLAAQQELVDWLTDEAPSAVVERAFSDGYQDAPGAARRGALLTGQLPGMVKALRRLAPDVLHVNNGGFPGSDLCRMALPAARLAGIERRVMTVHSNPWPRERLADPRLQRAVDRTVWSASGAVICPSKAVAAGLSDRRGMPVSLGRMIHYGVPRPRHDPQAATELRTRLAPSGALLVGMVSARPVPEKGYDVFLDSLAAAGERVHGVLVGPAPEGFAELADTAGLQERLTLEGPRENVGDYYAAFDVLVVPSTAEECMPLVILEAASLGTPTFGSRLAGIPEAIADGESGRVFESRAAGALAALMRAAERDRAQTSKLGEQAQARWQAGFQLEAMVEATIELYAGAR
ncbi:MAG TPA: glycosyltransferase family 4 protein [Solirubrobacteraceae bacterium]|nr:glycosyltransferase family 4 protein [Solirubrobacteraceae bacterium]